MLSAASQYAPYPTWLNPGDNAWQLISATLVGLMSIPALAVLYGGLVQKKWIVNTMFMVFAGFSLTLVVWVCWGYSFAFGTPQAHFGSTGSFWSGFIGNWFTLFSAHSLQDQAQSGANTLLPFNFPTATFAYFQFVFAAIIGPRLRRDRTTVPSNLMLVAVGAGILWLGWNGFNGGDMYYAGMNASAAVLNTNLATAVGVLSWMLMDMMLGKQRKPTFLGAINGMLCGLVAITPAAGFVDGVGAIAIGFVSSFLVWFTWNFLSKVWPFRVVDDAMGVVYTHGFAGLIGGVLVGLLANPGMAVYLADPNTPGSTGFATTGAFYGNPKQLWLQLGAAGTIIVWDGVMTFLILSFIRIFVKLRMPDEALETGDVAIHDEEAYPSEPVLAGAGAVSAAVAPSSVRTAEPEPV